MGDFVNRITRHDGEFVSWEALMQFKQEVQQGAEKLQHEVEHAAAELKKEAQHEAEEFKKEVATDVAAGRQALTWLKECFESLTADDEGAVSKEELANKL